MATKTRRKLTVQAAMMPSAVAGARPGSFCARCEKPRVTAVLDTSPPSSPVRPRPCSPPSTLTRM